MSQLDDQYAATESGLNDAINGLEEALALGPGTLSIHILLTQALSACEEALDLVIDYWSKDDDGSA